MADAVSGSRERKGSKHRKDCLDRALTQSSDWFVSEGLVIAADTLLADRVTIGLQPTGKGGGSRFADCFNWALHDHSANRCFSLLLEELRHMIRLASKATLLSAVALVVAGAALAGTERHELDHQRCTDGPRMVLVNLAPHFGGVTRAELHCTAIVMISGTMQSGPGQRGHQPGATAWSRFWQLLMISDQRRDAEHESVRLGNAGPWRPVPSAARRMPRAW
jgi:hypothetical protein